jgi:hypothetical protein
MSSGFYTPNIVKGIVKKKNVQTHAVKNVYNMRRSTMKIVEDKDGDGYVFLSLSLSLPHLKQQNIKQHTDTSSNSL